MNLKIIGCCIWIPIWILSYVPAIANFLDASENYFIGIAVLVIFLIGVVISFVGLLKS